MAVGIFVMVGVLTTTVLYAIIVYNRLVALKHNISAAWSNIDILLKQRHDEIPKLVETCKQYMRYEQGTLERVMRARSAVAGAREKGNMGALGSAEVGLRAGLSSLFAVAEAYPELKASEKFQHLQTRKTIILWALLPHKSVTGFYTTLKMFWQLN